MSVRNFVCGLVFGSVIGLTIPPVISAQASGIREVSASERSLIPLQTRLRYTTMIVLPDGEEILDVICGDRDFWVISATQNIAHVKPAKEGAATNLNLVTSSGSVYSFLLTEKNGSPDLKVYVKGDERAATGKRKYYSAAQVEGLEAELRSARAAVETAGRRADEAIAAYRQEYPTRLRFAYGTLEVREAVSCPVHVARWSVHLYQGRRQRAAGAVRGEGRQAVARELPGAPRHVRGAEGAGRRLPGARQGALRLRATGVMAERAMADTTDASPTTVAASPATVTDNRPVPRGVLPRGVQTWIMAGIAVGMLAIMLLVGRSDPPVH